MQHKKSIVPPQKKLNIGTRVQFLTSKDVGVITEKLGDGMVKVLLDGIDMEIPVFESDLMLEQSPSSPFFEDFNLPTFPQPPTNLVEKNFPTKIPQDFGFWVVLEMSKTSKGDIEKFNIHLLNATSLAVAVDFELRFGDSPEHTVSETLLAATLEPHLSSLTWDELNDAPNLFLRLTPLYTEGGGKVEEMPLKIRYKQLLKHPANFPFWQHEQLFAFKMIEKFEYSTSKTAKKVDSGIAELKKYTQNALNEQKKALHRQEELNRYRIFEPTPNVDEYAHFPQAIDLHIEMLHNNPSLLNNNDIVQHQLRAFDHYLNRAIRLGVPKVFIIHGVGKGRLKEMIAARLRRNNHVKNFKNEYHQKYGWGATEVILSHS